MIYFILAILTSSSILILFKVFERYRVNTIQAITINYLMALTISFFSVPEKISVQDFSGARWLYLALILGGLFIAAFYLFARSAQKAGVAVTAISSRMSVMIPVMVGFFLFNEPSGLAKIGGILVALVALYLTLIKEEKKELKLKYILLPLLVFLFTGIVDSLLKTAKQLFIENEQEHALFLATIFSLSFVIGLVVQLVKGNILNRITL